MTEVINNNEGPNPDLVDNSNNCRVDSSPETSRDNKLSNASLSYGQETANTGEEEQEEQEEQEYTIRIPFFTLDKYKKGLISKFDEIIDVRTPLEYQEDRVPGSTNWPVLSNEERVEVGTLYAKDKMAGRKLGAALISKNISQHILTYLGDKPGNWRPLIYCWRGGQRSRSLAIILRQIGYEAHVLMGGYKEYRALVRDTVQKDQSSQMEAFKFILLSGNTGNGKSRILEALREAGEQVLHLEELAKHKGSVLGNYHNQPQPNQKLFESEVFEKFQFQFKPGKVIWVEYESFKIGNITVPKLISNKMLQSDRIHIEVDLEDRIRFILKDYEYLLDDKTLLIQYLEKLKRLAGKKKVEEWSSMVLEEKNEDLVRDLVKEYYDKCYRVPRGEALRVFHVPEGTNLSDHSILVKSPLINEIMKLGQEYMN